MGREARHGGGQVSAIEAGRTGRWVREVEVPLPEPLTLPEPAQEPVPAPAPVEEPAEEPAKVPA